MSFSVVRALRSSNSERFLIRSEAAQDSALLDVHYLDDGSVSGTLVIVDDALAVPDAVQGLLEFIDESLFPSVSLNERTLSFTVVHGKPIGQFENEKHE